MRWGDLSAGCSREGVILLEADVLLKFPPCHVQPNLNHGDSLEVVFIPQTQPPLLSGAASAANRSTEASACRRLCGAPLYLAPVG